LDDKRSDTEDSRVPLRELGLFNLEMNEKKMEKPPKERVQEPKGTTEKDSPQREPMTY